MYIAQTWRENCSPAGARAYSLRSSRVGSVTQRRQLLCFKNQPEVLTEQRWRKRELKAMTMAPADDLQHSTFRVDRHISTQQPQAIEILDNFVNAYITNGLAEEYDTERLLLVSDDFATSKKIK